MPCADLGTSVQAMAITPTTTTMKNSPERISRGFQRTVIGRFSFGSSCGVTRRVQSPLPQAIRAWRRTTVCDVGNSEEILDEGLVDRTCAWASDRRWEIRLRRESSIVGGEGATPFALIPQRGRNPLPLSPRIRAPHTIETRHRDHGQPIRGDPACRSIDRYTPEIAAFARAALARTRQRLPGAFDLVKDNDNVLAIVWRSLWKWPLAVSCHGAGRLIISRSRPSDVPAGQARSGPVLRNHGILADDR